MKKSFAYPYGVWLAVFILAPILMVVVYAFHNADGGFTLHNFSTCGGAETQPQAPEEARSAQ